MRQEGLPLELIGDKILDHKISISAGGSPTDPRNMVLQDRDESYLKDRAQSWAHALICSHRKGLREVQSLLWNDWRQLLPKFIDCRVLRLCRSTI